MQRAGSGTNVEHTLFILFILFYFKTSHHFIFITEMKNKNIAQVTSSE